MAYVIGAVFITFCYGLLGKPQRYDDPPSFFAGVLWPLVVPVWALDHAFGWISAAGRRVRELAANRR